MYCKNTVFFICGDFNARCAELEDYIPGVDCIQERGVIDFTLNKYGKLLCDFLIDSNCCILNGRNKSVNNYTFTGVQGLSVVDYCLVPYEYLNMFDRFTVTTATELINNAEIVDEIQRSTTKPDHSVLSWNFNLPIYSRVDSRPQPEQSFTWFDRTNVLGDFLGDSLEQKYLDRILLMKLMQKLSRKLDRKWWRSSDIKRYH